MPAPTPSTSLFRQRTQTTSPSSQRAAWPRSPEGSTPAGRPTWMPKVDGIRLLSAVCYKHFALIFARHRRSSASPPPLSRRLPLAPPSRAFPSSRPRPGRPPRRPLGLPRPPPEPLPSPPPPLAPKLFAGFVTHMGEEGLPKRPSWSMSGRSKVHTAEVHLR